MAEETVGMDSSVSQEDLQNVSVSQAQAAAMAMSDAKMEYDADNRLISYNGEEVKYDADGNMIYGPLNGTMTSFTYDCRNRLIQAGNTQYVYDAENTRIAVETETGRTEYVTDVVSELSQVLEAYVVETKEDDSEGTDDEKITSEMEDAKSDKPSAETVERTITYIYGNGLIYEYEDDAETATNASIEDEEVSVSDNTETSDILVHHYNHIGSTMKLTNAQGEVVESYQYGTYGELLSGDTTKTAYLYNGMYGVATDENGLYYMRARYYNTDIKRFINRDVVKGSMENSQSLNRYSYVQGNPVSLTDPFGLSPFTWSNIGHGLLNALGMIPYIGEVFDLANAAWYMKEGNYAMAALSAISALPMLGNIASGALTMFKCAKVAKYVKTVSKVISNAATFGVAAAGGTKSIKNIYKNVKQGNVFTKENFAELANIGLSAFTMICSGKNTIASGKELGGMLKEDVPKAWSSVKKSFKTFAADNRGVVDFNAPIGGGTSTLSGQWKTVNESMSDFSRAYQKQITGQEGMAWVQNGVKFDGMKDGVLLDAKGKYAQFIDKNTGEFYEWFSGKDSLIAEARRQIVASEGAKIQWYFAEEESLNVVQDLFMDKGITEIELIFEAPK